MSKLNLEQSPDQSAEPTTNIVTAIRSAAPYVHAHQGKVFVICFGGEAAADEHFEHLIYDLALLHSLGIKLVIVHGARPQIEAHISAANLASTHVGDLRVTDLAALQCVKAAVGTLRMDIEARLSTSLASTAMAGAKIPVVGGNWVTAQPVGVRGGVDHQHTGEVRKIDTQSLLQTLEQKRVALLSPVGYSPSGEIFNLRAEDVATAVATALHADKLMFVVSGNPRKWDMAADSGDAGQISAQQVESLISANQLNATDKHYLLAASQAASGGVKRTHIIGFETEGAVLRELFTRDGCGVLIHADSDYEIVREAHIDDIGGLLNLIQPLEEAGKLVPRSREQLELDISNFIVMLRDGMVIACCALFTFPGTHSAELACVAVHPSYRGAGRAATLLNRIEKKARKHKIQTLFTLTTHTPHWFIERGFSTVDVSQLPVERQQLYNYQRKSLVLLKTL